MTAQRALLLDTSVRGRILTAIAEAEAGTWRVEEVDASDAELDTGLPVRLAGLLARHDPIDAVVVTLGPGSYTGVRGGIAAAAGLSAARGLPLHGLTTFELAGAAAPAGCGVVWAGVDAGRGGLYVARVRIDVDSGRPREAGSARRVDAATWTPPPGEPLVTLEAADAPLMRRAAATAVGIAMKLPALDLAAVEPVTVELRAKLR